MPRALIRSALAALASLGLFGGPAALAGEISPEQAPAAWVAYAHDATQAITAWLNAEAPPAPRVRAVIDAIRPAPDHPNPPPLVLKVWIARDGAITRIEAPPLGDPKADADLRSLIVGQHLPSPPAHMKLPLRLGLQLKAAQPSPPPGAGGT
jgi:hypothetical protein